MTGSVVSWAALCLNTLSPFSGRLFEVIRVAETL